MGGEDPIRLGLPSSPLHSGKGGHRIRGRIQALRFKPQLSNLLCDLRRSLHISEPQFLSLEYPLPCKVCPGPTKYRVWKWPAHSKCLMNTELPGVGVVTCKSRDTGDWGGCVLGLAREKTTAQPHCPHGSLEHARHRGRAGKEVSDVGGRHSQTPSAPFRKGAGGPGSVLSQPLYVTGLTKWLTCEQGK